MRRWRSRSGYSIPITATPSRWVAAVIIVQEGRRLTLRTNLPAPVCVCVCVCVALVQRDDELPAHHGVRQHAGGYCGRNAAGVGDQETVQGHVRRGG